MILSRRQRRICLSTKLKLKLIRKVRKTEDSPAAVKTFQSDYRKDKISAKKDTEIENEVTSLVTKLAEDPTLKDAKVGLHKDIQALLAQKR